MRLIYKNIVLAIVATIIFTGCGGGGSSSSAVGAGGAGGGAKGPFKEGSTVIAYQLDANGSRSAMTASTLTTDARGHFSFGTSLPWTGATEFVISGEYLNESTGAYMNLPASNGLSAIVEMTDGVSKTVNINIFTDIEAKSIKASMADATDTRTVAEKKTAAQEKVKELFNLSDGVVLEELDLTDGTNNAQDNTQLLLISSALLNTDNPEKALADLGDDLADGEVNDSGAAALEELKEKAAKVDLQKVVATMEDANIGVTNAPNADRSGILSFDHNISFANTVDAFRNTSYTSNEATVVGISGGSGVISIVDGTYSIDGGAFVSTAGIISNGQKLRVKTTSAAAYSTLKEAKVTIGGGVIVYKVITKADPFVPDTTPNAFSFGFKKDQAKSQANTESLPITITGINTSSAVTIDNGEFKINNGAWGTTGNVNNDDNVTVRHTTSANFGTQTKSTLTIGGVIGSFSTFTLPEDKTPNPFTFTAVNGQELNATVESNLITISGINTAANISVEGGTYDLNAHNSFTSTSGTILNDDTLKLRLTTSLDYETEKEVKVTINNSVFTFKAKTKSDPIVADTTPDAFSFASKVNQPVDTDVDANITVSGINQETAISIVNGTYVVNGASADANVSNGDVVTVTQRTSTDFDTAKETTLTIGGVSAVFKTKTKIQDKTPDDFSFDANLSAPLGTQLTSNTKTLTGFDNGAVISVVNGEYSIGGGAYTNVAGTIDAGQTLTLRQTSASTQGTSNVTTVTVGEVSRSFTTKTVINPPAISGTPVATATEDALYEFEPDSIGEIASWSIANKPSWAEFNTINGKLSGTPRNDDVGTDSNITITATNAQGSDSLTAFDIVVNNTNDAPVASGTSASTNEDTSVDINATALVTDVDSADTKTFSITTDPTNGAVSVNGGVLTYTPAANYNGTDSFVYTVTDSGSATATGTITVTVNAVNDAPVAVSGTTFSVKVNETLTGQLSASDIDSANLTYSAGVATPGSLTLDSNGSFTYTAPASEQTITFTYTVSDGGSSANGTHTINVVLSAPPVAVNDTANTDEDTAKAIVVTSNDTDDQDTGSLLIVGTTNPTHGTLHVDSNTTITYTPTANYNGADSFTYTVEDSDGGQSTATVSVTVAPVNDAPVASNDSATTPDKQTSVLIDVLANDTDVDSGDTLSISAVGSASKGAVAIEAGKVRYTPNGTDSGADSFTYTLSDGSGGTNTGTVNVTINQNSSAAVTEALNILEALDIENDEIDTALALAKDKLVAAPADKDAQVALALFDLAEVMNNSCIDAIVDHNDSAIGFNYSTALPKFVFGLMTTSGAQVMDLKASPSNFSGCTKEIVNTSAEKLAAISDKLEAAFTDSSYVFTHNSDSISKEDADMMRAGALFTASQLKYIAAHNFGISDAKLEPKTETISNGGSSYDVEYRDIDIDEASVLNSNYFFAYKHAGVDYGSGYVGISLNESQARLDSAKAYLLSSATIAKSLNPAGYALDEQADINDTKDMATQIYNNLIGNADVVIDDLGDQNASNADSFTLNLRPLFTVATSIDAFDVALGGKFTYDCTYDRNNSILNGSPTCENGEDAYWVTEKIPSASESNLDGVIKSITLDGQIYTGDDMIAMLVGDVDFISNGHYFRDFQSNGYGWMDESNSSKLVMNANIQYAQDTSTGDWSAVQYNSKQQVKLVNVPNAMTKVMVTMKPTHVIEYTKIGPIVRYTDASGNKIYTGMNIKKDRVTPWISVSNSDETQNVDFWDDLNIGATLATFDPLNKEVKMSISIVGNTFVYSVVANGVSESQTFDFANDLNTTAKTDIQTVVGFVPSLSNDASFDILQIRTRTDTRGITPINDSNGNLTTAELLEVRLNNE